MTTYEGPAPAPRVTGPSEVDAAPKQHKLDDHRSASAAVLVSWRRPASLGVVVRCVAGCGQLHQHVIPLDSAEPVVRESRCRRGPYRLALADVLAVTA
ncbi:hypothetical protein ACI798_20570 [Geodermatophilus sp. SYSU D01045]